MPFQQVGILGLGLIGTSLGLALKRPPAPPHILGFDVSRESLERATGVGAIDRPCATPGQACEGSDVVVLAATVRSILELLPQIAPHVAAGSLVTDTGGTKAQILRAAEHALGEGSGFVGGHPLTGRLTAGVGEPSASLYRGAVYCLAVPPTAAPWAVDLAVQLVESVGAQPYFVDADEHDALLAGISHLPYLASVALVNAVTHQPSWPEMGGIAAGGFGSISALVDADPRMWADVAATNADNVARQLDALIERLTALRTMTASGDAELIDELSRARASYRAWRAGRSDAAAPESGLEAPPPARRRRWSDVFRLG